MRCQALGDLLGGTLDEAKPLFYNEELGEEGRLETEPFQQVTGWLGVAPAAVIHG